MDHDSVVQRSATSKAIAFHVFHFMQKTKRAGTANFTFEYVIHDFYRAGLLANDGMLKINIAGYFKCCVRIRTNELAILFQLNRLC